MNTTIEEFQKWLLAQEKKPVKGEMTLGKINEYRTHMCKHAFEGGFNAAQDLLSQGKPVAWLVEGIDAYTDYARAVGTAQANMRAIKPLFLTQPSTESLQKDKAEMIAYIENLLKPLQNFVDKVDRGEARSVQSYTEMKNALAIPQPQCMQEG